MRKLGKTTRGAHPGIINANMFLKQKKNNMFQTALSMKRGKGKAEKHGMGRPLNMRCKKKA